MILLGRKIKQIISVILAIIMIAMTTIPSFATTSNQSTKIECIDVDIPIISSLWNKIVKIFNDFIEFIRYIVNPEGKIKIVWKYINYENTYRLEWIEETQYYEYGEEVIPPDIPTDRPSFSEMNSFGISTMTAYYFKCWNTEIQTVAIQDAEYEAEYAIAW